MDRIVLVVFWALNLSESRKNCCTPDFPPLLAGGLEHIALAAYVPFLALQCSPDVWSHMAGITEMLLRDFRLEFYRDGFALGLMSNIN